jgi:Arc/MetJ-type ribon-helix-helix transcriptional regulator
MPTPHVTVKLPKELVEEMDKLQGKHGFRGRGEIAKQAIRELLAKYEIELKPELENYPRMIRINASDQGATMWDNKIRREVNVIFTKTGIKCSIDDSDDCDHVAFALKEHDVRTAIKKRRKEGWKLPDI